VNVTPAGSPDGVTVTVGVVKHALGVSDAVRFWLAPPGTSVRDGGDTAGVKSGSVTLTRS